MVDRIDIHIGQHKTGTSAIQKSLNQNRKWLLKHGIFYPQADCLDAHHQLASYALVRIEHETSARKKFCATVNAWLESGSSQNYLLLSSEMFSEGVDDEFLKGYFSGKEVRVIIYIRRQDLLIESVYNQILKQDGVIIDDIVINPPYNLDTWSIINRWENTVGEGNVIVKKYESKAINYENIACDFLEIYKITEFKGFYFSSEYINKSLGLKETRLLEEMILLLDGKHMQFLEGIRARLKKAVQGQDISMVGNFLDPAQRVTIMEKVEEGNNKILHKYFSGQDSLFEPIGNESHNLNVGCSWAEIVAHEYLHND